MAVPLFKHNCEGWQSLSASTTVKDGEVKLQTVVGDEADVVESTSAVVNQIPKVDVIHVFFDVFFCI